MFAMQDVARNIRDMKRFMFDSKRKEKISLKCLLHFEPNQVLPPAAVQQLFANYKWSAPVPASFFAGRNFLVSGFFHRCTCVVQSVDNDLTGNAWHHYYHCSFAVPSFRLCVCVCARTHVLVRVQEKAGVTVAFPLATKHLVDIKYELCPFARWKALGLNLGLSPESLEVIENDYRQTEGQLEAVLLQWLKRKYDLNEFRSPSWGRLAEAVKPIDHALALTIQERHPS